MREITSEAMSRRKALALLGLGAALGLAGSGLVTASDAKAETVGMDRRQDRRAGRQDRRQDRRDGRQARRDGRQEARAIRRE
jgi:hypothetical protein